mmetsp:Transcript_38235/g.121776  ORF Transcript_38235/g.121776 Transcript_38235/m.121776 type:complete len:393 (+) Transcript_38235:88-1266(+)
MLAADTEEPTLAAPAAPAGAVPAAVEPQTAAPVSTPAAVPSAAGYPAGEAAKAPVAPAHAAAADTARTVAETSAAPIAAADTTAALATAVGETTADGEVPTAAETSPSSESGAEAASVDLPAAAQAGLYGRLKEKAAPVVQRVAEMESVQKATQYVVDTSKVMHQKVSESERIQQSVDFVRRKTTELAESERLQKGIEVAKERTKAMRQSAGAVWQQGRGSISKVRANVSAIAWKGSARDTLDIAARDEMWTNMRVQGAEELVVPARTEHTSAYHVSKGSTLRWTFRVKEHDVGFGVRMRVQEWGGSREDEVLAVERYDCADTISGSWVADEDRTIILAFDNRYSRLRSKSVAYLVGTEKPPVFTEPAPFDTAPVSTPAAGPPSEPAVRAIV